MAKFFARFSCIDSDDDADYVSAGNVSLDNIPPPPPEEPQQETVSLGQRIILSTFYFFFAVVFLKNLYSFGYFFYHLFGSSNFMTTLGFFAFFLISLTSNVVQFESVFNKRNRFFVFISSINSCLIVIFIVFGTILNFSVDSLFQLGFLIVLEFSYIYMMINTADCHLQVCLLADVAV